MLKGFAFVSHVPDGDSFEALVDGEDPATRCSVDTYDLRVIPFVENALLAEGLQVIQQALLANTDG